MEAQSVPDGNDFVISLVILFQTALIAYLMRKVVRYFIVDEFVQDLYFEGIAAAEQCACCFELGILADYYGIAVYAFCLFLLSVWWSYQWANASACPYGPLEEVFNGVSTLKTAFYKIMIQLICGLLVYKYIHFVWRFEVAKTHVGRAARQCTTDLKVSLLAGAFIELIATCICRVVAIAILASTGRSYAILVNAFVGTSLVVLALDYSGGYFNPLVATSMKYGCEGHTFLEHVFVYWIGSISGSLLSIYIYRNPTLRNLLFFGIRSKKIL